MNQSKFEVITYSWREERENAYEREQLVLVVTLIGWKSGASFLNQSGGVVNAMPITFRHSGENRFIVNFEVIAPENPNGKAQRAKIASLRLSVDNTKKAILYVNAENIVLHLIGHADIVLRCKELVQTSKQWTLACFLSRKSSTKKTSRSIIHLLLPGLEEGEKSEEGEETSTKKWREEQFALVNLAPWHLSLPMEGNGRAFKTKLLVSTVQCHVVISSPLSKLLLCIFSWEFYEISTDINLFFFYYKELFTVQECTLQETPHIQYTTLVAVIRLCTSPGS